MALPYRVQQSQENRPANKPLGYSAFKAEAEDCQPSDTAPRGQLLRAGRVWDGFVEEALLK